MKACPVCQGSRRIRYGDVYTNHTTHQKYVGWETGREIACGCTQLVPIKGEAS
jgi:hypothetical protein